MSNDRVCPTFRKVLIASVFGVGVCLIPNGAQSVTNNSATLQWDANQESDLAGYKIYQRKLPSIDYGSPVFSGFPSNPAAPQITITNLLEGETYGFIATAFDTSGNQSAPSLEKQITTTTGTPPPPTEDTPPPPTPSSPPLAHWTFNESAGVTAFDSSANGYDGTVDGAAWTTSGTLNGALDFDGNNDFVDIGTWDVSGSAITLAMWFKADDFGINDARLLTKSTTIAEQDHYFMLSTIQSGGMKLRFRLKTDGTTHTLVANSGTLSVGEWIHAVAVYDGSEMRLYKDGVEVGSRGKTGALSTNDTVKIRIAQNPNGYGSFDGLMDDVRVYDRALTSDEIQQLAGGSAPPIDTTSPSVPADLQATPMSATEISLQWTPATDEVGVTRYTLTRNGTAIGSIPTPSYTDQGLSPNTLYTYTVTAEDAAGNVSAPSAPKSATTMSLPPDTTSPSVTLTAPAQGNTVAEAVTLTATATDNVEVVGVQFQLNGANLGPEDTTNSYAMSWDTTTVGDGTYSLTATARDAAGNTMTSAAVTVTVNNAPPADTTSPSVTLTAPAQGNTVAEAVTLTATATDNVEVVGVQFQLNGANLGPEDTTNSYAMSWDTTTVGDGIYSLTATARDAAGNTMTSAAVTVTVNNAPPADTTSPSVTLTAPAQGNTVAEAVTLTATATDNVEVVGVQFQLNGANLGPEDTTNSYAMSWDTTTVGDGTYSLTATARDAAGNTMTSAAVTVTVNNAPPADTTSPSVTLTAPAQGNTVAEAVTLTATATDNVEVVGVQFQLNGANLGPEDTTNSYAMSWDTTTVGDGTYSLTATARDAAGNTMTSAAVTVTVNNAPPADTTSPSVTLTAPAQGNTVAEAVTLTATATDNVEVVGVQFQLNGANLGPEDTTNSYAMSWDTTTVGDGTYSLTATARDAAGNTMTSAAVTVTVNNAPPADTTSPSVTLTAPAQGNTVAEAVTLTATATDNVEVVGVQFQLNGANLGPEDTTNSYAMSWDTTTVGDGIYSLTATARDAAGNTMTSAAVTVTVNNAPPADTTSPSVTLTAKIQKVLATIEQKLVTHADNPKKVSRLNKKKVQLLAKAAKKEQKKLAKAEKLLAKIQKVLATIEQKLVTHADNPKKVSRLNKKKVQLLANRDKIQEIYSIN